MLDVILLLTHHFAKMSQASPGGHVSRGAIALRQVCPRCPDLQVLEAKSDASRKYGSIFLFRRRTEVHAWLSLGWGTQTS